MPASRLTYISKTSSNSSRLPLSPPSVLPLAHNAGPASGHPARAGKSAKSAPLTKLKLTLNHQQTHVHLLSTYRFPNLPALHPDKVAEWLLGAPKIARGSNPFYWTYLDRPVDNSIYLIWQSLSLGSDFPSDGYIWPPHADSLPD